MILPFIIAGLTTGSVYGLAGVGLVLTYKTSGVFNFAQGALATVAAYLFYTLHVQHGMAWPLAGFICVFVLGPVLGLLLEILARALANATLNTQVASTVGILLMVQAGVVLIYGTTVVRNIPPFLPGGTYNVAGTSVTSSQIVVFAVGVAATAALYGWFRLARGGVAMRAVVDNPELLDIAGTSPVRVRRLAWIIGSIFACASGVLLGPFINLDPTTLTFLIVSAFGAAAIGRFSNLPGTYIGGLALGIAASLCTKYFTTGVLSGLSSALPFLVLFVVLMVSPRRRLEDHVKAIPERSGGWTAPWPLRVISGVALLIFLLFVPGFAGIHLNDWTEFLATTVLLLSLGLLTRTSGQVSLAHVSFMAIGVAGFSHLAVDHHWPWGAALVVAGLIAVPIGALLSIPAIRLSGLYLALTTFGFGILLQYMFYNENYMFGDLGLGVAVPTPYLSWLDLSSANGYYYLVLAITLVVTVAVLGINFSRLGRLLRGLGDSATALATSGTSVNVTRVLVFALSAFLAAIAGVLGAASIGQVSGDSYQPITSLVFFTLITISVGGTPWFAILAAAGYALIPSYLEGTTTSTVLQLIFGVIAVMVALTPASSRTLPSWVTGAVDAVFRRGPRPAAGDVPAPAAAATTAVPALPVTRAELAATGLRVQFGGLVAVDDVSVTVRTGRITGLIGPNGAGKTTVFNACSGLNRPNAGRVLLDGRDLSRLGPAARARRGLGRTFQRMELFDSMSVRENVALGYEAGRAGLNPLRHLVSTGGHRRRAQAAAEEALRRCDLLSLAGRPAGALSTGQRRLVELARCLAGPHRILLLDEPSSGLDRLETARFGEILQQAVAEKGIGILLVEHDVGLVASVCDEIYVLDFGRLIYAGAAADALNSPVVQAAYLGTEDVAVTAGLGDEEQVES
jgi:ABC-type branched-subunit amino acid transport system ATPase component/branched-subunit amino acid ABC-type transport system permease component